MTWILSFFFMQHRPCRPVESTGEPHKSQQWGTQTFAPSLRPTQVRMVSLLRRVPKFGFGVAVNHAPENLFCSDSNRNFSISESNVSSLETLCILISSQFLCFFISVGKVSFKSFQICKPSSKCGISESQSWISVKLDSNSLILFVDDKKAGSELSFNLLTPRPPKRTGKLACDHWFSLSCI